MRPKKFTSIAEDLGRLVRGGGLEPGGKLPSQSELTKQYRASRSCVQKALDVLAGQGLVVKKPGLGVFAGGSRRGGLARTGAIGVLLSSAQRTATVSPNDNFGLEILWGMEQEARTRKQSFLLRRQDVSDQPDKLGEVLAGMRVDGLLLDRGFHDAWLAALRAAGVPAVVAGRVSSVPGVGSVAPNLFDYIHRTCLAMAADGLRRVWVPYPGCHYYADEIVSAVGRAAHGVVGTEIRAIDYYPSPDSFDATTDERRLVSAIGGLLDSGELPEAILCISDWSAMRVLDVLKARGIVVPDQVGVIGALGLALGERTEPPLTTLALDAGELGRRAVRVLLEIVERGADARIEKIPFTFVERGSFMWRQREAQRAV